MERDCFVADRTVDTLKASKTRENTKHKQGGIKTKIKLDGDGSGIRLCCSACKDRGLERTRRDTNQVDRGNRQFIKEREREERRC